MAKAVTAFQTDNGQVFENLRDAVIQEIMDIVHDKASGQRGQTLSKTGAAIIVDQAPSVIAALSQIPKAE